MNLQRLAAILTVIYSIFEISSYLLHGATLLPQLVISGYNLGSTYIPYFEFLLIAVSSFILGRLTVGMTGGTPRIQINTVPGCSKDDGVCWKGEMVYRIDSWSFVFDDTPVCPTCQTPLQNMENAAPADPSYEGSSLTCPKDHVTIKRPDQDLIRSHKNVLKTHLDRIVSSEDGEFSLDNLADECLNEHDSEVPTGEDIWKMYVEQKGDSELSTDCFY